MLQNQCISVTDLRTKTKECLKDLKKEPKYIFVNNRPIAVIMDIAEYEEYHCPVLRELDESEVAPEMRDRAEKARKASRSDLVNI
ncbi:MAG: type II toxin-antitoxin system Phd/YefM family antitoxin [Patescibacteria group bacterium]